jgi:hypothetical protein
MRNIKLFIHIGTHKTGTTAIQSSLNESTSLLKMENIYYFPLSKNAIQLMTIKELNNKLIATCKKELFKFIKKIKNKNQIKIIWSFEGFSGNPLLGYKNSKYIAESLRRITKEFETKIIVYIRRQDIFVESLYTQMIHQGESYDFKTFIDGITKDSFNWNNLLDNYSNYFGKENLIVCKYEKYYLVRNGSIVNHFKQIIGKSLKLNKPSKINKGYSRDALEIARILNRNLTKVEKTQLRRLLRNISTKDVFEYYSYWKSNERNQFLDTYSHSNSIVAKEYFNDTSGVLFRIDKSILSGRSNYSGLTLESTINIFGKLILQQNEINYSFTSKVSAKLKYLLKKYKLFF